MPARIRCFSAGGWCVWRPRTSVNADPQALVIANAAKDAYDFLGSPEGELALAQACVYLATAPKSNGVYKAYKAAMRAAKEARLAVAAASTFSMRRPS
jgi:hypothetical protein